jgi:hypothetical protein
VYVCSCTNWYNHTTIIKKQYFLNYHYVDGFFGLITILNSVFKLTQSFESVKTVCTNVDALSHRRIDGTFRWYVLVSTSKFPTVKMSASKLLTQNVDNTHQPFLTRVSWNRHFGHLSTFWRSVIWMSTSERLVELFNWLSAKLLVEFHLLKTNWFSSGLPNKMYDALKTFFT